MQTVDLLVCRECGGRAETLVVHRSEQLPFSERLGEAWRYPFTPHGFAVTLALGTILALLGTLMDFSFVLGRLLPAAIGAGAFWSLFFAIVRSSARGEKDMPLPDFNDLVSDGFLPTLRGLMATVVVWLPPILYATLVGGTSAFGVLEVLLKDPLALLMGRYASLPETAFPQTPLMWGLRLAGLAYLPMALMVAAAGASPLDMLNPVKGVRLIGRLGRDYVVTLGVLLTLGVVLLIIRFAAAGILWLHILFLSRWLAECLECLVPFVVAHVLGLLLHTRGDVLGYGAASDYLTPVLPAPSTSLRPQDALPPVPSPAEANQAESGPSPDAQLQALAAAVDTRDIPQALALYTAALNAMPKTKIAPAQHLFVGQAAAAQGDHALAVRALESAADVAPEDPLAPRALVLLARVLGERMGEDARARDVYQYIVDRYPETEASRFARARLPPTT